MAIMALVADAHSSGEIFNNGFVSISRYLVDETFNIILQCLGGRGLVVVNLGLQKKTPQKKVHMCLMARS